LVSLHVCHVSLSLFAPALLSLCFFFFFTYPSTTAIYTLSLHDALPIYSVRASEARPNRINSSPRTLGSRCEFGRAPAATRSSTRSEEHTSELQSRENLVCRLLLEKKKRS